MLSIIYPMKMLSVIYHMKWKGVNFLCESHCPARMQEECYARITSIQCMHVL